MSIAGKIAAGIRAALATIGRVVARRCAVTGQWLYETVRDATVGAGEAILEAPMNLLRDVARLPGQVLRGTGSALEGAGHLVGAAAEAAAAPINALTSGLTAGRGGGVPMPPPAPPAPKAEDRNAMFMEALKTARAEVERTDAVLAGGFKERAGFVVHAYASARPIARSKVDVSKLTDEHYEWLVGLDDVELRRLAQAGPLACDEHLRGTGGVRGVDYPGDTKVVGPAAPTTVKDVLGNREALAARATALRSNRTVAVADWHP